MKKLTWCLEATKGIEYAKPNKNLAHTYLAKAKKAILAHNSVKRNTEWEITTAYYAMYFASYAILANIGVKCEIHSCTISLLKELLGEHFTKEELILIELTQKARINTQYYSDKNISKDIHTKILKGITPYFTKCTEIVINMTGDDTQLIRDKLFNPSKK